MWKIQILQPETSLWFDIYESAFPTMTRALEQIREEVFWDKAYMRESYQYRVVETTSGATILL